MKGVDYIQTLYTTSGLSIGPKTKLSKMEQLKQMSLAWGMDPNKILCRKTLTMPQSNNRRRKPDRNPESSPKTRSHTGTPEMTQKTYLHLEIDSGEVT